MELKHTWLVMARIFLVIVGSMTLLLTLSAWSYPGGASAKTLTDSTSYIRVIHASPDIGTVDVFVDGNPFLSNFQFATVTAYVPLPSGQHKVQAALIGKGVNASALTQTIDVQPGSVYTVAAIGTTASGFSLHVFTDDNTVNKNNAKLRVYHLSPGTQPVNVKDGDTSLVTGLSYEQSSKYVALPAGQYTLNVSGGTLQGMNALEENLKPWTVTSVFAVGLLNGSPKLQFVSTQVQGIPQLPATGSDPNAQVTATSNTTSPLFWLASALMVIIASIFVGRYCLVNRGHYRISTTPVRHNSQKEQ